MDFIPQGGTSTTTDRIRDAVTRNGLTWGDVIGRVSTENGVSEQGAGTMVDKLRRGDGCPLVVAAAVISLVADQRHTLARRLADA